MIINYPLKAHQMDLIAYLRQCLLIVEKYINRLDLVPLKANVLGQMSL